MSVRSVKVSDVIVNGAGAAQAGVLVTATLLVPGTALALDSNGDIIDLTPLTATTDTTGTYTFDPAASPTNGLIAPGDIYQLSGGVLVALGGCTWQITYLSTIIVSPSFAYTASTLHPSSWVPSLPTLGFLKMDLTDVLGSGAAIQSAGFAIAISQPAIWSGGAGVGQRVDGSFTLSTNSAGQIFTYLIRSSELNPSGTPYTLVGTGPGAQRGTWTFTCPATYSGTYGGATYTDRGVYAGGTTYALNDVVRRAADDVPFVSLTNANTGNALSDGTHWAVFAGAAITANLVPAAPPLQVTYNATVIAHDANVPVLFDDPVQSPATLDDDLHNLAARTSFAVANKTGTYTITAADDWITADATGAAFTLTLPAASARQRPIYIVRTNGGGNNVTVARAGADTINGATTLTLAAQYQLAILKPNAAGTAWYAAVVGAAGTGGSAFSWVAKAANYSVLSTDSGILGDATSGPITITLPSAAGITSLFAVKKKDSGANAVTVATTSSQTIDGQTTRVLATQDAVCYLASDGSNWYELADLARAGIGTAGQVPITFGSSDVGWTTPSGIPGHAGAADVTTAEGDIIYRKRAVVTALTIGFIGDSVTANTPPTSGNPPPTNAVAVLAAALAITVTAINEGVGGTTTANWLPGSTNLTNAKAAFGGPATTPIVHIMFGTNDADNIFRLSASTYQANMQAIVNDLTGAGYKVAISYPPFAVPTAPNQDTTANSLRVAYQAAINAVVNGRDVFLADTSAFLFFQANPGQLWDGYHPSGAGTASFGTMWAAGLQPLVAALVQQTTLARLPIGANGQVLAVASGYPAWQNSPTGFANPMTTLGDLITGGASGVAGRLGIGTSGQVLTISGGVPTWATPTSGFADPTTTKGDLIVHGASTTRLGVGSDGFVLTANSLAAAGVDWEAGQIHVPAVTGDTPGPVFIVTGDGQCVLT